MSEATLSAGLLLAAFVAGIAGMGWLALSMPVHAQQAWGEALSSRTARVLRCLGASSLFAALLLCLAVDHASMASLVWVMTLAASALVVAFALSSRPTWLRALAPWVRSRHRA
ncbi:DUF3325 domain-containing protein [Lysobacter auxotrophicus]|uniref:DUF3325 domain-containing protein n=1 Tax=Lysobacter auxotrophicus TaxID=2992573 RepID=A0ABM8DDD9_9GAMM|nr:DUF3325 domain-containing protein [Lysobacter auxotrophicus]BDU16569.1 DUF3325 domain-containing protein [Lysobacter auxotrophicus]